MYPKKGLVTQKLPTGFFMLNGCKEGDKEAVLLRDGQLPMGVQNTLFDVDEININIGNVNRALKTYWEEMGLD